MFLSAILLALIVGVLAGGGIPRLADLRLRWLPVLALALAVRIGANLVGRDGIAGVELPVGWAYLASYALIFAWLWANWRVPGLQVASVGIASNSVAVVMSGGHMPIWAGAYFAAGFPAQEIEGDPFHFLLMVDTVAGFVGSGGLFGDVIPIPLPIFRDVVSIGDVLLALGIFWVIVYSMTRPEAPFRRAYTVSPLPARGLAGPPVPGTVAYAATAASAAEPMARPDEAVARPRAQSAYLRLVRNREFSLLWLGQLVSMFGDRIHLVALGFLVAERGTPLEVGLTFAATAAPNVLLGPLAGAFVDRWDRRRTMIGCDIARAGLVLLVPLAIEVHIALVYLATFSVATISLLFRPARTAIIPAVVEERDLMTANSASTISETAADLVGLPLAGVIVASLSGIIGAAFVLDSATYVVSAVLLWAMFVPREQLASAPVRPGALWSEMVEGWQFLTRQRELLANTLITGVAQVAVGAEIVVSLLYARSVLDRTSIGFPENYSLLLAAVAFGSVAGGLAVGALGERLRKGLLTIGGLAAMGLALAATGFVTDPMVALVLFFVVGAANVGYLIPTITLFQERTPQRLMGRVVSSRQALTFGMIAISMAASGWLAEIIGPAPVFVAAGGICAVAGLAGLLVPAMREAH